jgi:hypothetical protein
MFMDKIFEEYNIVLILIVMFSYFISVYFAKKALKKEYNNVPPIDDIDIFLDNFIAFFPIINFSLFEIYMSKDLKN